VRRYGRKLHSAVPAEKPGVALALLMRSATGLTVVASHCPAAQQSDHGTNDYLDPNFSL